MGCSSDSAGGGTAGSPSLLPTSISLPPGLTPARVARVIDGDTIEVQVGDAKYKVRYIGMNTPESVDPRRPVECFGKEASDRNKELVDGKTVGLEKDVSETDEFGRLLRYVWLEGRLVNATLVSEGYAQAATYPPDVRYAALFAQLQKEAREAGRGLWGAACAGPTPSPQAAAVPSGPGVCAYSGTAQPVIKGNISVQKGEKIYHVPGQSSYAGTVVNESKGERWFCTEEDAVAAGWRKSSQ